MHLQAAWFLAHRIREAMRPDGFTPMGGNGKTVEADETYICRLKGTPVKTDGAAHKNTVLTLVERGGVARSFHIDTARIGTIVPIVRANIAKESALMTESGVYRRLGKEFASHEIVTHSKDEYGRRQHGRCRWQPQIHGRRRWSHGGCDHGMWFHAWI